MNRKIFALFALTAGMHLAVHASENVNTPENRQFLKQQETLSQQLREKPDTQLQAWAEQQVRANPLQHSDNQFLDELVRKQQAAQKDKPQQGAVYFVSFSIPEEGLKRMLGETRHYGIPATLRGMVNNDLKATAEAVLATPTTFLVNVNTLEALPLLQGATDAAGFMARMDTVLQMYGGKKGAK